MAINLVGVNNMKQPSNLEIAKELLQSHGDESIKSVDEGDLGLEEYVVTTIKTNVCSTISVKYQDHQVMVVGSFPSGIKLVTFPNYTAEDYIDFCQNILGIDPEEKYNCSRSKNFDGVKTRIYAAMPPLAENPIVTISTTKMPPDHLENQTIPDELFNTIVHSNFLVTGGSGSGKTYLFNYLLNKFIKSDERIGIIEEFMEIIPPNQLCYNLICPPPKPGEKSLLRFMTEQSNLMRLDAVYVGEIKGPEAWPFVVNMASGSRGACTLHGDSPTQALSRLRALCQLDGNASPEAINEFIAKSVKYIIQMKKHKIECIERLTGTFNKNTFAMEEIYS